MSERPDCMLSTIGVPDATLEVTGPERASWLNGLLTCDARRCTPGHGVWGLALNRTGKIQSVCWLVATDTSLLVGVPASTASLVLEQFEKMLVMEDAEIVDVSNEYEWALLVGARCEGAAQAVASGRLDLFGLGELALVHHAGQSPVLDAVRLDEAAWTTLCLERGLPRFGVDFDATDRPHEAALDRRAVDWQKGCYLGQEVVCMQDMRGKVSRSVRRVAVRAERGVALARGALLSGANGEKLGTLTSVAYSERAGCWLAMVQLPLATSRGPLCVTVGSQSLSAEVVEELF